MGWWLFELVLFERHRNGRDQKCALKDDFFYFFKKCHSFVKIVKLSYRGSELGLRSRKNPTLLGLGER